MMMQEVRGPRGLGELMKSIRHGGIPSADVGTMFTKLAVLDPKTLCILVYWLQNAHTQIAIPGMGLAGAWTPSDMEQNLGAVLRLFSGAPKVSVSGQSATPLGITDQKTEKPLAMFLGKPPLALHSPDKIAEILSKLGIDEAKYDPMKSIAKLIVLAHEYPAVLQAVLGQGLQFLFNQLYTEPLLGYIARMYLGIGIGVIGFTHDDMRGITLKNEDRGNAVQIFQKLGFSKGQYTVNEAGVYLFRNGKKEVMVTGDFQIAGWFISQLMKDLQLGTNPIDPTKTLTCELDSNIKAAEYAESNDGGFKKRNGSSNYDVLRNGANVTKNILFQVWKNELNKVADDGDSWYQFVDDQIHDVNMNENLFVYLPEDASGFGHIYKKDGSLYQEYSIEEVIRFSFEDRKRITAAVYAGIGCELRYRYSFAERMCFYGGMIKKRQPNKFRYMVETLDPSVTCEQWDLPDAGVMTTMKMLLEEGHEMNISQAFSRKTIDPERVGKSQKYYQETWAPIRDAQKEKNAQVA